MEKPSAEPVVVRYQDIKPFIAESPDHRELRVMLSPKRDGSAPEVSVGVVTVKPGPVPPAHSHDTTQESWYFFEGKGQIRVGDQIIDVEPGTVVVSPPRVEHQLIAKDEVLRAVFILSPAGDEEKLIVP